MTYDFAVIGGGIVGAATFYKLQKKYPEKTIALFEKEALLADHQTGHNSGVIHSGLYYKPGSLKAKNCIEGRHELVAFAQEHGIDHDVCGKIVVATDASELENLEKVLPNILPTAEAIMQLARPIFAAGEAKHASEAAPIYIRNRVALTTQQREAGQRL